MITLPLAILAIVSAALILWQWRAATQFVRRGANASAHDVSPISVLKPLKGCDAETEACLESWLKQDYAAPVQVVFGLSDPDDPAAAVVHKLMARNSTMDVSLLIAPKETHTNEKVSKLVHMERLAKHDLLVVSDADVRAPANLLRQLAAELHGNPQTVVCCLYCLANPSTTAMQWEAVSINSDFWSQVLQAQNLAPLDFALGATMALHRPALQALGGFEAFANQLADDYQLGHRLVQNGGSVRLSAAIVECWESARDWGEVWRHQLRWARTIRVCRPIPYFFSILANGTLWPVLWMASSLTSAVDQFWVWPIASTCLALRAITARDQQRRINDQGHAARLAPWWMPWLKDFAQVLLWAAAFAGDKVRWRGQDYRVQHGGRLVREAGQSAP